MIKRLKNRPRSDSFDREPRKPRQRWDRLVYLTLLAGFALSILNYVAGDKVFLRADGLVLRTRSVVEATSLVQVRKVYVSSGQSVAPGDDLLLAQSYEIIDRLSELSMLEAGLAEREAALRKETTLAKNLLPLIKARNTELVGTNETTNRAQASGLITATRQETVVEKLYIAKIELATLTAQVEGFAAELNAVIEARRRARQAINDLSEHYGSGIYRVGTAGVIGDTVPAVGEVFNPGEPILTVLSGKPHVLAYLPSAYMLDILPGERVVVTGGKIRRMGTIKEILPVSQSVPDEFRNAFRLDETRQLARIVLDDGTEFPTFSAVRVAREIPWRDWRKTGMDFARGIFGKQLATELSAGPSYHMYQ